MNQPTALIQAQDKVCFVLWHQRRNDASKAQAKRNRQR